VFAKRDWKTVPWCEIPKTPKDILVDVLVEIPGLFETFDKLSEGYQKDEEGDLISRFVRVSWQIDDELKSWYATTGSGLESLVKKVVAKEKKASIEHLASAQLLLLYWCGVLLYREVWQAVCKSAHAGGVQAQIPPPEDAQFMWENILEVMTMLLKPCSGFFGINIAAFPMTVIFNHIHGKSSVGGTKNEGHMLYNLLQTAQGRIVSEFVESSWHMRRPSHQSN
jgi:hypothetical protein